MPQPNEFICTKFDILCNNLDVTSLPQTPKKIFENEISESFHKLDCKFKLPHGFICVYMVSPVTIATIEGQIMTSLFSMILKYYLSEQLYPATCAGLGFTVYTEEKGLLMKFSGYDEKLPLLLDIITKNLKTLKHLVDEKVFNTFKLQYKRNGHNNLIVSKSLNKEIRLHIVEEHHKFSLYRYQETDRVSFEEFKIFCDEFLKKLRVQFLFQGNISKEKSLEATEKALANLNTNPIPQSFNINSRAREIPQGTNILSVHSFLMNDKNSTLTNYIQLGQSTIKLQSLIEFVEKIMEEPLFDVLRTKEQLGYSVECSHRFNNGILGLTVAVQSQETKHSIATVFDKVENFVNHQMPEFIEKMTDEEFESNKQALIKLKNIIEVELETEVNRHWGEITSREYIFNRLQLEAEAIGRITKDEVLQFYKDRVISKNASKLSIQVVGYAEEKNEKTENSSLEFIESSSPGNIITDIEKFKDSLIMYPVTKTLIK